MRFHMRVGRWLERFVANVGGKMHAAIVEQHLTRHGGDNLSRRIGDQPAQHLAPEHVVRGVAERLAHLPAPHAAAGHDGGTAATIILGDDERQLVAVHVHFGQHGGAGLGRAGVLVVHQVRKFFPALDVFDRIVDQARDDAVRSRLRQFDGGGIAMESYFSGRA